MRKSLLLATGTALAPVAGPAILHSVYVNTFTNLIGALYAGLDTVSRELVGMIPSVSRDASLERAAVGQAVTYHVTPSLTTFDVTPAMVIPEPANVTIGNGTVTITKSKGVEFGWTGEEQKALNNGAGYNRVQADLFAQGLRTLVNMIEVDLCTEGAAGASRAYGTAGAVAFQTNVGESAQIRKILDDNGAPPSGRSLIINTSAGAALRTLSNLTKANEAGTTMTLRDGQLLDLNGLSIKESAGIVRQVAGTAAGATTNAAGYAIGATAITMAVAGTGTILAGDSITFAGDSNKYIIAPGGGLASAAAGGTITLAAPGLRVAIPAAATAVTVIAAHDCNLAFSQDAIQFVMRAPALPEGGDAAVDRMLLVDPRSGLVFEVALYAGYRKMRAEVVAAWGQKAVKTSNIALLLG